MLQATVSKKQERCPLKCSICINSSCLCHVKVNENHQVCIKKFTFLLDKLHEGKWMDGCEPEHAKTFFSFCSSWIINKISLIVLAMFDYDKGRLDNFLKVFFLYLQFPSANLHRTRI